MTSSNALFSASFFKSLSDVGGNLVSSPLSAQMALGMTYLGTRGDTALVMSKALFLPENQDQVAQEFNELVTNLKEPEGEGTSLKLANRMFIKEGYEISQDYVTLAEKSFKAEPQTVDFVNPGASDIINNWVQEQTDHKITNIIEKDTLSELTRLVLVNAVYFNGTWERIFNKKSTRPMKFYIGEESFIETPFMVKDSCFRTGHIESLDATLVEIPYKGNQKSMVILLPNSRTGLANLEDKIQGENLSSILESLRESRIELFLPKFKVETSLNLKQPLIKLGLDCLFTEEADFSGITITENLYVSDVIQKTMIEVDEEGTTAAAVTKVEISARCLPPDVTVDHPFLFYVLHRTADNNHVVIFSGRVTQPTP